MDEFPAFCHEKGMKCAADGHVLGLPPLSEARYDTCTEPHAHFVCELCESVTDYPLPTGYVLPEGIRGGPHHWELRVRGICENCQSERKKERTIWIRRPCSRSATVSTC